MNIGREDKVIIARIAFEAETIAAKLPLIWIEQDEHVQTEYIERLDRVLPSLDPSVFGRVARSALKALVSAGLVVVEDDHPEEPEAPAEEPEHKKTGVLGKLKVAVRGEIKNPEPK